MRECERAEDGWTNDGGFLRSREWEKRRGGGSRGRSGLKVIFASFWPYLGHFQAKIAEAMNSDVML